MGVDNQMYCLSPSRGFKNAKVLHKRKYKRLI